MQLLKRVILAQLVRQPADAISTSPCPLLAKGEGVQLLKRVILAQLVRQPADVISGKLQQG